ncbi:MAG: ribosome recycling factor [Streptococcaceae bacterium]|jgi:ribosome recycling factor|nr:ribosome recycling factor [Streptococcaceae bacterium]
MTNELITNAKEKMAGSVANLQRNLGQIRAGRANASLLDRIMVEYYGAPTPLKQLASITIPEARVLAIAPFDKSSLKEIERSINESDLGITPANDGQTIRLVIPMLTEERRKELVKSMGKFIEEAKVAIRNSRRDAIEAVKKQQKASEISEDELKTFEKDIQKVTDEAVKDVEAVAKEKEQELLTV